VSEAFIFGIYQSSRFVIIDAIPAEGNQSGPAAQDG
jgi:hypothetical protein